MPSCIARDSFLFSIVTVLCSLHHSQFRTFSSTQKETLCPVAVTPTPLATIGLPSVSICYSVTKSLSRVWLSATPSTAPCQASLSFTISQILLKLMSIESVMPSNHLILCCPFLLLPSIFSSIRVFFSESALHRWPRYWSFSISLSSEYSGLISFRIDWLDLLAVQGTLKCFLQMSL